MTYFNKKVAENVKCLCGHIHRYENQIAVCHRKVLQKAGPVSNRVKFSYPKIRAYINAPTDIRENIRVLKARLRALKDREPQGLSSYLTLEDWISRGCPDVPVVKEILEERFAEMIKRSGRDFNYEFKHHQEAIDKLVADINHVERQVFR